MGNFKIGQKVVCVRPIEELILNEIYTIKSTHSCSCGMSMVELNEIGLGDKYKGSRCQCELAYMNISLFKSDRFRPLDHKFAEDLLAEITESVKEEELLELQP